jgi:hypothetical protein
MKMFQNKDRVGTELLDSVLATTHQNQAGGLLTVFNLVKHCCGSGSGIRCFFDPWIGDEHPGSYFQELRNQFFGKTTSIICCGSGIEKIWIQDNHPGSATLLFL